ncbi:MAG: acetylxylan esterase [Akkermansiaceae bacterium]|nr:acetylxylan esterase [Akkermansiaceae bacterium]
MTLKISGALALILLPAFAKADEFVFVPNYDETKVPVYTLPKVLAGVNSAAEWPAKRLHWHELIAKEMFGRIPASAEKEKAAILRTLPDKSILGGNGIMRQFVIGLAGEELNLMLLLPKTSTKEPVSVFLGYNFKGNHTVFNDPDIILPTSWISKNKGNKAREKDRGTGSKRWAVEKIIAANMGLATLYYGDVDPDFDDGFKNGLHQQLGVPGADEAASIGTWAWALSRILDILDSSVEEVDGSKVAVFGHSRLGKTSLWAGASDERFALVISNNSGCGGAALSRRQFGETLRRINHNFPHWFCKKFHSYSERVDSLPFDNHTLLSLIAPRPLYVASAVDDQWADPKGEFLSCLNADPVYRLLGTEGLSVKKMPPADTPSHGRIGYHVRTGKHGVTDFDWEQYIAFAKKHLTPQTE